MWYYSIIYKKNYGVKLNVIEKLKKIRNKYLFVNYCINVW